MASFTLSWTPAGGLISTGQQVQYKESVSSTWLLAATLNATANSYVVDELDDNVIYDFRIMTLCAFGGPTPSAPYQVIDFVCPEVTISPTYFSVDFSFLPVGGESTVAYVVGLLDAGLNVVDSKTYSSPSGMVTDSFVDLDDATDFYLRVQINSGVYSEQCAAQAFSTVAIPVCSVPTILTVDIFYPI